MRFLVLAVLVACSTKEPPPITEAWKGDFERAAPGGDWHATADAYVVQDGALGAAKAYNHPLWLRRKIPRDAVIELDCWSNSEAGDIKVEAWGDGRSHARDKGQYTATGYVFIMGGWSNSLSLLARGNEHEYERDPKIPRRQQPRVEPGKKYHWKIVRKGARIDWFVDDMQTPFLSFDDPAPYEGKGHDYFGFNNWESQLWFDNLTITPL